MADIVVYVAQMSRKFPLDHKSCNSELDLVFARPKKLHFWMGSDLS